MSGQVEVEDDSWFIDSIANFTVPSSSNEKIHRVPTLMKGTEEQYQKYFVPKVVSIGPYHHGNPKLDVVEKLKPGFTMKLLKNSKENLSSLWTKFVEPNKVKDLRNFYEEKSTVAFCDKVFVKMMLLDACFILYCIQYFFGDQFEECQDLKSHQIVLVRQDLLLLENQIPFQVLEEVMKLMEINGEEKIIPFIIDNILACGERRKSWRESICSTFGCCDRSSEKSELDFNKAHPDHLLHLFHLNLTKNEVPEEKLEQTNKKCTFRNASELKDVGIQFKPSNTMSLANVKFCRCCRWCFSASVELPPITVDDSTKPKLLNLIAYEMCSHDASTSWVTSYICLLDTLIDHPEDVKTLRKAGVLDNFLGSDNEVAKLFNEISTGLVPNNLAYLDAKDKIQSHYESWSNGLISQLKHEYVKSPWAYIALLGALMAFFLSGVQTYYTVWSPKGACDDLCVFLKNNHHL